MRKLMVVLLAAALCLLCACGEAAPEETGAVGTTLPVTTQATTTEAFTTIHIEYPASYKDAPAAYKPVLDEFYYQAQSGEHSGEGLGKAYILEPWFFEKDDFGYAVKDINSDGVPELLLLTQGHKEYAAAGEPFILSLFTLANDKPVHLAYYWRRECARLAADGTIYFLGGRGGSYTGLRSYVLDAGTSALRQLSEYTRDAGRFFEGPYGGQPMEEEAFNELYRKYDNPSNPMKLKFIPIGQ
jgi:hypothetical protein